MHGGSKDKFHAACRRLASLLDIQGWDDREVDVLQMVKDRLTEDSDHPWLMILDNADSSEEWLSSDRNSDAPFRALIDYLPRCAHGNILITTRDSQLGQKLSESKQKPLDVERLSPYEAEALLRVRLTHKESLNDEDAKELTAALEYLPLTIGQAAAYLNEIDMSAQDYLILFRRGLADVPELLSESIHDPARDRETSNSIFQTWRLSFRRIAKEDSRAAELLSIMSMLDREGISEDLLRKAGEPPLKFKRAIAKLKAYSFIQEDRASSQYSMHRLVQISTQRWLDYLEHTIRVKEAAVAAVSACCPVAPEYILWPTFINLKPHIMRVLEYTMESSEAKISRANILHCFGHFNMWQGEVSLFLKLINEAQITRKEELGPDHIDTLTSEGLQGVAYSMSGNSYISKAEEIQRNVLDRAQRVLGPDHRLTLKTRSRLAIVEGRKRNTRRSRDMHREILTKMQELYGPEDRDAIQEMSHLIYMYNNLKQWREAEDIGKKVLEIRSRVLGPEHPDSITIKAQLCWTYTAQRRLDEALELGEQVLEVRLQALGPDHPKTLVAMTGLARTLHYLERNEEAIKIQQNVIDTRKRLYGDQHGRTVASVQELRRMTKAKEPEEGTLSRSTTGSSERTEKTRYEPVVELEPEAWVNLMGDQ